MRLNVFNSLMGLCVATAAVSCSNDQVIDDLVGGNDSDMISFVVADDNTRGGSFGNRPGSSTRGAVTTADNITNNSFAVYGDQKKLNSSEQYPLFSNETVSYENGEWTYSNLRYWFPDYEYSFIAFYPADAIPVAQSSNDIISEFECVGTNLSFTYTHPSDYSKTKDILIAGHRRQCFSSSGAAPVVLNFGHILSRINFKATVDAGVEIKRISISNLASKASFSAKPAAIGTGATQTSDLSLNDPVWAITTETRTTVDKSPVASTTVTEGKTIELFPITDPLIVIPQTVSSQIVEVVYIKDGNEKTIVGNLNATATTIREWQYGKSYTYSFKITDNEYIVFDQPELKDWDEADGSSYIIIG